jgi:hypothetical protein
VRVASRPPVAVIQAQDANSSCSEIQAELAANTRKIAELEDERHEMMGRDIVLAIFTLGWLPFGSHPPAAPYEIMAFKDRNAHLATLATERCEDADAVTIARAPRSAHP